MSAQYPNFNFPDINFPGTWAGKKSRRPGGSCPNQTFNPFFPKNFSAQFSFAPSAAVKDTCRLVKPILVSLVYHPSSDNPHLA